MSTSKKFVDSEILLRKQRLLSGTVTALIEKVSQLDLGVLSDLFVSDRDLIARQNETINGLRARVDELEAKFENVRAAVLPLVDAFDSMKKDIIIMQKAFDRITTIEDDLKNLETEVSEAFKDMSEVGLNSSDHLNSLLTNLHMNIESKTDTLRSIGSSTSSESLLPTVVGLLSRDNKLVNVAYDISSQIAQGDEASLGK